MQVVALRLQTSLGLFERKDACLRVQDVLVVLSRQHILGRAQLLGLVTQASHVCPQRCDLCLSRSTSLVGCLGARFGVVCLYTESAHLVPCRGMLGGLARLGVLEPRDGAFPLASLGGMALRLCLELVFKGRDPCRRRMALLLQGLDALSRLGLNMFCGLARLAQVVTGLLEVRLKTLLRRLRLGKSRTSGQSLGLRSRSATTHVSQFHLEMTLGRQNSIPRWSTHSCCNRCAPALLSCCLLLFQEGCDVVCMLKLHRQIGDSPLLVLGIGLRRRQRLARRCMLLR